MALVRHGSWLGCLVILAALGGPVRAADVYFDISATQARKIDIAVPLFRAQDQSVESSDLATEIRDVLLQDLKDAGLFNVIDISAFYHGEGSDRGDIDFKQWYLVGMQALVTGSFDVQGDDLTIRSWLYDVPMGQLIAGRAYTASRDQVRDMVHRLADELVYRFTGERGVADSKIFAVILREGAKQICVMDADGRNLKVLTSGAHLKLFPAPSPARPDHPGGEKILYTSYAKGQPDLYLLRPETGSNVPVFTGGLNSNASWSPDGRLVAFTRSVEGNPDIFVSRADGTELRRLTFSKGVDSSPCWSPTGREIVFTSDRSGTPQLWLMDAEGGNQRRLTYTGRYNDAAQWSPRGDRIVFQSRWEGRFDLASIRPDGSGFLLLTADGRNSEGPCWSPDGRRIVYSGEQGGKSHLYVLPASGGVPRRITDGTDSYTSPRWVR